MNSISSSGGSLNFLQSASTAVNRAAAGVSSDAASVAASAISDGGQMLAALINSRQQLLYTQAAAKMLDTADEMMGTLLDVNA